VKPDSDRHFRKVLRGGVHPVALTQAAVAASALPEQDSRAIQILFIFLLRTCHARLQGRSLA
jgi:hypothetical protein